MFGQNGTGLNFRAQPANIQTPTTNQQATDTYTQAQDALAKQKDFLAALTGQNGIQNQTDVYNQLKGVAAGTGPNPAATMLSTATGANNASTAALMAGQRGSAANPGMVARLAAQQGAANNQNAAGQAATLQANQSLNAINSMGNVAGQQVNNQAAATGALTGATQAEQQNILNAVAGQNNAEVGMQSNINNANAGIAGIAAKGQQDLLGGAIGGAGSALGLAKGGKVPSRKKMADGGDPVAAAPMAPVQPAIPAVRKGPASRVGSYLAAQSTAPGQTQPSGSYQAGQGVGSAIGSGFKALAGAIKGAPTPEGAPQVPSATDWSLWAKTPEGAVPSADETASMMKNMPQTPMAKGGKVPVLLSPGEIKLSPKAAKKVAEGKANPMAEGKMVPGKARVKGNSYANDTVKDSLEPGSVVVDRETLSKGDPMVHAVRFVQAVMAKHGSMPKKKAK